MNKIFALLITIPFFSSCFKEDKPINPHILQEYTVSESIYTHESYFGLASAGVVEVNPIEAWDLGFESSADGYHIIINSGKYLGIYSSGTTDFNALVSVPVTAKWKYDKSDGNLDSTALGRWVSPGLVPTGEVYVMGINDGVKYSPYKKIVFTSLVSGIYTFMYANMDGTEKGSFSITKNQAYNFVYFTFAGNGQIANTEPPKSSWDFVFTQYSTTLYTNLGVPTPYFVRGVLSNPNGVGVAIDSVIGYPNISLTDISSLQFSSKSDAIGYDWKSVKIDGTTATYAVRPKNTYIIRSIDGNFYKLHFTGFFNDLGSPGYPRFEVSKLI